MRIKPLYVVFLSLLPMFSFAQCKKPAATLKVKIDAPDSEQKLLAEKLTKHGCNRGLVFQFVETGFDYRIVATDTTHFYSTISQSGSGSHSLRFCEPGWNSSISKISRSSFWGCTVTPLRTHCRD